MSRAVVLLREMVRFLLVGSCGTVLLCTALVVVYELVRWGGFISIIVLLVLIGSFCAAWGITDGGRRRL